MKSLLRFAACFLCLLFLAQSHAEQSKNIIAKQIYIYNNTDETIYPIIEAPIMAPNDAWLQAEFQEKNINVNKYNQTKIHRVYVNPESGGIAPGQSVTLNVPFYSQLVKDPDPAKADQYIDWWNAIRVYFYDDANSIKFVFEKDKHNLVTPVSPGPSCVAGNCGALPIYSNTVGLPLNDPYQLTEYTFANVVTSATPYTIDTQFVDYDISYVDHVYLCMAMEPYQNVDVGYTGTTTDLKTCRSVMNKFVTKEKWPAYTTDSGGALPHQKIPGMYNVLMGNQPLTPNTVFGNVAEKWLECTIIPSNPEAKVCQSVNDLFFKNLINYQYMCGGSPTSEEYLQHLYGWVPFSCDNYGNDLASTPGAEYATSEQDYQKLQYDYKNNPVPDVLFNPYVEFIHSPDFLNMNAYAFSIDDAVGNMNEKGDGLIFAIGGAKGLPNNHPYDPAQVVHINLGNPITGPTWVSYGISTTTPASKLNGNLSFPIQTVTYPCTISLQDSKNKLYHFIILSAPPFTGGVNSKYIECEKGDSWCAGVNIDFGTKQDIATPPTVG